MGESKTRILNDLDPPAELRLAMTLLAADETPADRLVKVRAFMDREGLSYPIVLKPDVGERGKGMGQGEGMGRGGGVGQGGGMGGGQGRR